MDNKGDINFKVARRELVGDLLWNAAAIISTRQTEQAKQRVHPDELRTGPGSADSLGWGYIAVERLAQILEHGRGAEWDQRSNSAGQLLDAAVTLAYHDHIGTHHWPWQHEYMVELTELPKARKLQIAGALIAAEIDRLVKAGEAFVCVSCGELADNFFSVDKLCDQCKPQAPAAVAEGAQNG